MTTTCPVIDSKKSVFVTSLEANIAFAIIVIAVLYLVRGVEL